MLDDATKIEELVVQINKHKRVAIYLITDSKDSLDSSIIGIALSFIENKSYYIPFEDLNKDVIKNLFEADEYIIIGFDLKFVIKTLYKYDIKIKSELFDVQIAHYLLHLISETH